MSAATREIPADCYLQLAKAEDPYPMIHRLRAEDPVHWTPFGFWFVTRHDDVKRLFNDPENATGDRRQWQLYQPRPEGSFLRWAEDHSLFALPPEQHARIRRLVSAAFTPRAVRRQEDQIREVVEAAAAPLRDRAGEVIDVFADFTNPIPIAVISRITGVPAEGGDDKRFRELAQSVIAGFLPFTPPELAAQAESAFEELYHWVTRLAAERRANPREDLISDLVQVMDADERLDDREVITLVAGLIAAGSETTALGGLAIAMTLLRHPDVMERLRGDRARIPSAVNELVRFAFGGPAGLPRYAVRDFELRGKRIERGQMLLLSFGGANRDPEVYADPDTLDIDRANRDLATFGNGPHYCLGANLARQELGCMLDALLDLLPPGSAVVEEQLEFREFGMFKRPLNLPVSIPARADRAGAGPGRR
ncbi:MAG TPA: cytochrome P450 [Myxococcota bacterium]|nr:cytochrome P450 [Myxococcota bacterium]